MNRIIAEKSVWKKMYEHVISDDNEHFAFFLANHVENQDGVAFLVRDVICIKDSDLESDGFGIKIKLEALLEVTNHARKNDLALIEIHSHPFATKNVNLFISYYLYLGLHAPLPNSVHLFGPGDPVAFCLPELDKLGHRRAHYRKTWSTMVG